IGNAVAYSPVGATVTVSLQNGVFFVENSGIHIAEEDLKLRGPGDFFGARQHGLPQLKLASLEGDMRLLHQAQAAARALLAQDPDLAGHPALRQRVEELFQAQGDGFN
ncbi:MAG: hypothetical protein Q3X23_01665, partial [Evtepia sp.]|nr:hypothetical protein [Evtepia sp.]